MYRTINTIVGKCFINFKREIIYLMVCIPHILNAFATWLVHPSNYFNTYFMTFFLFLCLPLFWREFMMGQEVTHCHCFYHWLASTFSTSALLLSSPSLGLCLSISLSFQLSYAVGLPYCINYNYLKLKWYLLKVRTKGQVDSTKTLSRVAKIKSYFAKLTIV